MLKTFVAVNYCCGVNETFHLGLKEGLPGCNKNGGIIKFPG